MRPVVGAHRNVLAHLDVIAHLPQVIKKLPFRHRLADGSVHIGFDEGKVGGAAFLLGPPFPVVLGFAALGVFNDGQAVFPAQPVGFPLHGKVILFAAVILDPVNQRHGIDDKMVVQVMGLVQMGSYQHLVFFAPQLFRQGKADLMGQLRRGLAGGKGLIAMVGYRAFLLAKPLFHGNHLVAGGGGAAIHPGDKPLHNRRAFFTGRNPARFFLPDSILDDIRKPLGLLAVHALFFKGSGVLRLIRVLHIDDHFPQPAVYPPDGCGSHSFTPLAWAGSRPW